MPTVAVREAAFAALAARLESSLAGVAVRRGLRGPVRAEHCPIVVLRAGPQDESPAETFGLVEAVCDGQVEGFVAAPPGSLDPDRDVEAAIADLHARCAAALVGVEIPIGSAGGLMLDTARLEPNVPTVAEAADGLGAFVWSFRFTLVVAAVGGPYTTL